MINEGLTGVGAGATATAPVGIMGMEVKGGGCVLILLYKKKYVLMVTVGPP